MNPKTSENSPDRGSHASTITGAPRPASSAFGRLLPSESHPAQVRRELRTAGGVMVNLVPTAYVAPSRTRDTAGGAGIGDRPIRGRRRTAPCSGRGRSVLPKSFNLSVPSGGKVWVAPNATKHIWEETRGLTFGRSISQEQRLAGLADAVDGATVGNWEQMQVSRGWELIFSRPRKAGEKPVPKHARYTGGDGS